MARMEKIMIWIARDMAPLGRRNPRMKKAARKETAQYEGSEIFPRGEPISMLVLAASIRSLTP